MGIEHTRVTGADAQDDLANVDTGNGAVGLAPGTTHTGLQTIGTSARQHLVDTDDVVWVSADAQVETFLAGSLDEVLVGANTGGLEGLRAQLLILVGDEVNAEREIVNSGTLAAKIENADLWVGNTAVEAGLGVRLEACVSISFLAKSPPPSPFYLSVPTPSSSYIATKCCDCQRELRLGNLLRVRIIARLPL